MTDILFLTIDDVIAIHQAEIQHSGGQASILDYDSLTAAVVAPQASFNGEFLMDLWSMASAYIVSISIRHPFSDGNKRVALASALTFLWLNNYEIAENHPLELADLVLEFLNGTVDKNDIANHIKLHAKAR